MKNSFYSLLVIITLVSFTGVVQAKPDPKVIPVTTQAPIERKIYPVAIIGAGAAGTMAVKRSVLNNTPTLLFAGAKKERKRSRGYWVRKVDNIPGFDKYDRTILELRNETLTELVNSSLSQNLFVVEESIYTIKKERDYFKLVDGRGHTYYASYVVLATGMMDEQPHIQGSIKPVLNYANGQTILYCSLCDGHRCANKETVVIGYSENAASVALLLKEKYPVKSLTLLTNGRHPEFGSLNSKLAAKNIKIVTNPIQEVLGNRDLKQLSGFRTDNGKTIKADVAFISLGVRPNNELALQIGAETDEKGLVIADENGETTVTNLFVIGDLRSDSMKQIYTAWQNAVEAIQTINRRIRENG